MCDYISDIIILWFSQIILLLENGKKFQQRAIYICTSRWLQHIYVDIVIYLLMLTYINIDVFVYNVRICIISYKSKIFKCMNPIAFYLIHNFIFNKFKPKFIIDGNILIFKN